MFLYQGHLLGEIRWMPDKIQSIMDIEWYKSKQKTDKQFMSKLISTKKLESILRKMNKSFICWVCI